MTNSIRTFIRHQVKQFLLSGEIKIGDVLMDESRIHTNRLRAHHRENLPQMAIQTIKESAKRFDEAPVSFERELTLAVVVIAHADDTIDDMLDAACQRVEDIVIGAGVNDLFKNTLGESYINRVNLSDTDLDLQLGDTELGGAVIVFSLQYDTRHDPDVDDLDGFNIDIRPAGAQNAIFTSTIDIEQPEE